MISGSILFRLYPCSSVFICGDMSSHFLSDLRVSAVNFFFHRIIFAQDGFVIPRTFSTD